MTAPQEVQNEVFDLFWSLGNGSFSLSDIERVELLARQYPEVRAWYGRFMVMCGVLQWDHATLHGGKLNRAGEGENHEGEMMNAGLPANTSPSLGRPSQPSFLLLDRLGSVGGVLLSYLCVAMVFAVGVVAARRWGQADDPRQLVRDAVVAPPRPVGASAPMIVGKITAMRDCRWITADPVRVGDAVPDGRVFVMASGLLEISYSSGARVTLEGPWPTW